ncbi:4-carboxymuconolactone decarboxylase [Azospirillum sp. B4]|uniref:4-carboxymuconolactone decarboxylase n=1 Tax=Azospirillum sp. B4 TaxID=95605 RepID=UPI00034CAA8E|nr:4-carboxymuconolactone decarboxylase [Azospirillum sp. B4]
MDEQERYEFGLKTRKSVLGDAHVDRALASRTEFNTEFQDLITRYAWGEIWTRPAIDHTTRRLMTLSMMIALNRGDEFKMHVRAAVQHGVSKDLIKEVILQSAIYCGVPAANTAFHQAAEVFAALEAAEG